MADRLTPLDASFLHTDTSSAHIHVAWKGRFRPAAGRLRPSRVGRRRALRHPPPRRRARGPARADARDALRRARRHRALACARPRAPAMGDPPRAEPGGRHRRARDEDPSRARRREVRARRRAAAARPRPGCARADPAARAGAGRPLGVAELLEVKQARGVSLNDVALAVVAGALRRLALLRGEAPAPLKVMVPVSRRATGEEAAMGNRIAFVFISVPVDAADPLARLAGIRAETAAFKGTGRAGGGEALLQGLGLLPLPLQAPLARFAASPRMYNLVISNVPGPRMPVYRAARRGG